MDYAFFLLDNRKSPDMLDPVTPTEDFRSSSEMGSSVADGDRLASHPSLPNVAEGPNPLGVYALPANDFTMAALERMDDKFKKKVAVNYRGCWIWTGSRCGPGYGQLKRGSTNKKICSHRYSYEKLIGPIPDDVESDHLCGVRACTNPYHIRLCDHSSNQLNRPMHVRMLLRKQREFINSAIMFKNSSGTTRTLSAVVDREVLEAISLYTAHLNKGNPDTEYRYPHKEKLCKACGIVKPVGHFYRVKDYSATYDDYWYPSSRCRSCTSALRKANIQAAKSKAIPPSEGAGSPNPRLLSLVTLFVPWALLSMGYFPRVIHA